MHMKFDVGYEKTVLPRDPENISSTRVELHSGAVSAQGFSPVVYDAQSLAAAGQRAVSFVPQNTMMLTLAECVMMFLLQLVPGLGMLLDGVWSFSRSAGLMKRTIARALLIVQAIVWCVVAVAWLL